MSDSSGSPPVRLGQVAQQRTLQTPVAEYCGSSFKTRSIEKLLKGKIVFPPLMYVQVLPRPFVRKGDFRHSGQLNSSQN